MTGEKISTTSKVSTDLTFYLIQQNAYLSTNPKYASFSGKGGDGFEVELVTICHDELDFWIFVQEEVLSDRYRRLIFYNITAKPVRQEFTLTHVFKGQFNMLNFIKR